VDGGRRTVDGDSEREGKVRADAGGRAEREGEVRAGTAGTGTKQRRRRREFEFGSPSGEEEPRATD